MKGDRRNSIVAQIQFAGGQTAAPMRQIDLRQFQCVQHGARHSGNFSQSSAQPGFGGNGLSHSRPPPLNYRRGSQIDSDSGGEKISEWQRRGYSDFAGDLGFDSSAAGATDAGAPAGTGSPGLLSDVFRSAPGVPGFGSSSLGGLTKYCTIRDTRRLIGSSGASILRSR